MQPSTILLFLAATLSAVEAAVIDHDTVVPFEQPEAATNSDKIAVRLQPVLYSEEGCASYPAVNAAGDTSHGLEGTAGTSGCKRSLHGSQVYARATLYNKLWVIMYAWYFLKGFSDKFASRRHDWANIVVFSSTSDPQKAKVTGLSMSRGDKYLVGDMDYIAAGVTPYVEHSLSLVFGPAYVESTFIRGDYQPLITWEQLSEEARTALNTTEFGKAKVPFSDANFEKIEKAYSIQ